MQSPLYHGKIITSNIYFANKLKIPAAEKIQ